MADSSDSVSVDMETIYLGGKGVQQKKISERDEEALKYLKDIKWCRVDDPKVPEDEDEIDEEMAEELQNQMEQDYDIGSTIKDKIIPHAVSWFTGEAVQEDEFDGIGDDDDEDEDDEEEDEDEKFSIRSLLHRQPLPVLRQQGVSPVTVFPVFPIPQSISGMTSSSDPIEVLASLTTSKLQVSNKMGSETTVNRFPVVVSSG
ncbi:hypothetical protein L6452_05820 [Arctium lappa]|uniref:Uncharacterized protein n=1 Tax=Arctium lappa TaxID=4217 RepID=A0ACB9EH72_ARCLA|nr:hypothetical protein L6452_05820 [Arctium lappa]